MDFNGYRSDALGMTVDLVNARLGAGPAGRAEGSPPLVELLAAHRYLLDMRWTPAADTALWAWAGRLAEVFTAAEIAAAAELVNTLLADADITPHLTDHDGHPWHLHYSPPEASVLDRVRATTAVALATLVSEHGLDRHGVCAAGGCARVYADTSRNASRRYCSGACANRAAVAAHRARRRGG